MIAMTALRFRSAPPPIRGIFPAVRPRFFGVRTPPVMMMRHEFEFRAFAV
jgi:hypothetical protein